MSAKSSYRDAVMDDGRYVLHQVTIRLYQGGAHRPDIYFQTDQCLRHKNYNRIFNSDQRRMIQQSGFPRDYDIELNACNFDVSLQALLAEHTFGLTRNDPLLQKVNEVRDLRNKVCHPDEHIDFSQEKSDVVTDVNLKTKLQELLSLYINIIENLEEKTSGNLNSVKMSIRSMINKRSMASNDSNTMPMWGKVTVGVSVGVAALSLAGAIGAMAMSSNKNQTKKKEEEEERGNQTKNKNNEEECSVM